LLGTLAKVAGRSATADHKPARAGDVRHSQADISRIRGALGYEPRTTIEQGLARTVAAM
jgi:nucleoside-diphosphate-sugar epimerase